GLGRNCTLFDKTRKWAYRAIRQGWPEYDQWLQACYERASAYNLQFAAPLDDNEVSSIAKSIAKWTNVKFNQESFEDYVARTHSKKIQALRGSKSKGGGRPQIEKAKIDEIGKMLAQGFSMRNIAKKIKVSTSTVIKYRENKDGFR
ncbi:primase C-terminal domain-containing protein, partial [Klebsiella pneumoniae]|nr:primase C-terminal domain-containing protein [Klebsiella pneumoniae]